MFNATCIKATGATVLLSNENKQMIGSLQLAVEIRIDIRKAWRQIILNKSEEINFEILDEYAWQSPVDMIYYS